MTAPSSASPDHVRIDKWLWAVRLFKTRSLATEACKSGKVKAQGIAVKPSREVHPGDEFRVGFGIYTRTIRVTALLHNRVSASLVPNYLEDLTPDSELEKLKVQKEMKTEFRPRGIGRPTKLQRRMIDRLKHFKDFNQDQQP